MLKKPQLKDSSPTPPVSIFGRAADTQPGGIVPVWLKMIVERHLSNSLSFPFEKGLFLPNRSLKFCNFFHSSMLYTGGLCPPDPPRPPEYWGAPPPRLPKVGLQPPEDGPTRWTSSGSDHFQSGIRKGPTRWTSSGSDYFKSDGTNGLSSGIALIHKRFPSLLRHMVRPAGRPAGRTIYLESKRVRPAERPAGPGRYLGGRRPTPGGLGGRPHQYSGGLGGKAPQHRNMELLARQYTIIFYIGFCVS